ncbi:hypothetical protein FRB90_009402, partial [Tulasnella sp. 427]
YRPMGDILRTISETSLELTRFSLLIEYSPVQMEFPYYNIYRSFSKLEDLTIHYGFSPMVPEQDRLASLLPLYEPEVCPRLVKFAAWNSGITVDKWLEFAQRRNATGHRLHRLVFSSWDDLTWEEEESVDLFREAVNELIVMRY